MKVRREREFWIEMQLVDERRAVECWMVILPASHFSLEKQ